MRLLPSAPVIEAIQQDQRRDCELLKPSLAVILAVGELGVNPASQSYVKRKVTYGGAIGVQVGVHSLPQAGIFDKLQELNEDTSVHGIILELPLPDVQQERELCEAIASQKDVDGLHPQSHHYPATPLGIMKLLAGYAISPKDKVVTVNGAGGKLVGQGTVELMKKGAAAEVIEIDMHNKGELGDAVRASDILVTAVGKAGLIPASMIDRSGLVVVDAGVSFTAGSDHKPATTYGDVTPEAYSLETDVAITPHKGGVGPMTAVALFENVIHAARLVKTPA